MEKNETYFRQLILGFIKNSISPEEVNELYDFINREPDKYTEMMEEPDVLYQIKLQLNNPVNDMSQDADERLQSRLATAIELARSATTQQKPMLRRLVANWRWAAAAIFIIAVGVSILMVLQKKEMQKEQFVDTGTKIQQDVMPGKDGAILTLAGGQQMLLDSMGNGIVTTQGKTTILIRNGLLVYDAASTKNQDVVYNTITTPKGRQYRLQLPDGTEVWLNAASSITYPTAFTGNSRTVTITGEAYFEVTKNKSKAFYVKVNGMTVEVLGTRFNINSYSDEGNIKTTLVEGSVKVTSGTNNKTLQPGEQAVAAASASALKVVSDVNIEQIMAWKAGMFNFNNVSLQDVMRQLARWYDVEIEYKGDIKPKKFGGEIQRDLNLSEVLEGLKDIGVRFKIEGKKLVVMP